VEALSDLAAAEYLRSCYALHVMPTFLVLRRQEIHFQGVGHGSAMGLVASRRGSEICGRTPGRVRMESLRQPTEEAAADMALLNLMEDSEEVNSLIVKRVNPSARLDIVHARRGLPTLDRNLSNDDLEDLLRTEESLIHEAHGADGYAADLTQPDEDEGEEAASPTRYTRSATSSAVAEAYSRLLGTPDETHLDRADLPLLELMQAENREAFGVWCNLFREHLGIDEYPDGYWGFQLAG
jgi:hypothetical protein